MALGNMRRLFWHLTYKPQERTLGTHASTLSTFQSLSQTTAEEIAIFSLCVSKFPCTLQMRDVTVCVCRSMSLIPHAADVIVSIVGCKDTKIIFSSKYEKVYMNSNMHMMSQKLLRPYFFLFKV
jgi:hypothetical protein